MVAATVVSALATPQIVASPVAWDLRPVIDLLLGALRTGVAYAINFRLIQDEGVRTLAGPVPAAGALGDPRCGVSLPSRSP